MRFVVAFLVLIVLSLTAGCGKQPEAYGNFADVQSVGLVEDAVGILKIAHPPAKTRLNLMHSYGDDAFGSALVETLRREGYAIAEYVQPLRRDKYAETPAKPDGFDFGYIVDRLAGDGGMRLSLFVGGETLSRLYSVGGTPEEPTYTSMGDWVHRH